MKKFFLAVCLAVLPLTLVLSGCTNVQTFSLVRTTKNSVDFLHMVDNKLESFVAATNAKVLANATLAPDKQNFDVASFVADQPANDVWQQQWANIHKVNTELKFALMGYEMFEYKKNVGVFDARFLHETANPTLQNFTLVFERKNNEIYSYTAGLMGAENAATGLPVPVAKNAPAGAVDIADEVIKLWGNNIKFSANLTSNTGLVTINISPVFSLPTEEQVNQTLQTEMQATIDAQKKCVTIVYDAGGQELTKEVRFTTGGDGNVIKTVQKYDCNKTQEANKNAQPVATYTYALESAPDAPLALCGRFDFLFDQLTSSLFCQRIINNGNDYLHAEYYAVSGGHILGKIRQTKNARLPTGQTEITDLLLRQDIATGQMKYTFQKNDANNKINPTFLRDTKPLTNALCNITKQEQTLAKGNTKQKAQVVAFEITDKTLSAAWALGR